MRKIDFDLDGRRATSWGRDDHYCTSALINSPICLFYAGEPPHGDSYHELIIDSKTIRGFIWSGYLLWSPCGRYFTCDWLEGMGGYRDGAAWCFTQTLRGTIVVEPKHLRYRVLHYRTSIQDGDGSDDNAEEALWKVLLDPSRGSWENFAPAAPRGASAAVT